ncbi:MAG: LptF/LptG family permease [Flavobacterium sp.]|jgi:lipopolysaccharide export system permease protein
MPLKILDKYILKSFASTFASVFVILFFIMIIQGVWLFIAEIAGKGLSFLVLVKFFTFYAPTIVPMVLPLSVVLASIMTFGAFSENYEFAAIKSSGISLTKAMRTLVVFILLLSIVSFFFANNVIPKAQTEFTRLRKNIIMQRPSMIIAENQFSKIGNTNIKVSKKYGENENLLEDVIIHKTSNYSVNTTVIKAKNGELVGDENSDFLQLILYNGYYYEDIIPVDYQEQKKIPFAKSTFKKYIINMDLSELNKSNLEEKTIVDSYMMQNITELNYSIDSLSKNHRNDVKTFVENISQKQPLMIQNQSIGELKMKKRVNVDTHQPLKTNNLLDLFNISEKNQILDLAINSVNNTKYPIDFSYNDLDYKLKNLNEHKISFYEKFMIAYSCLLMFFIGAPLGAIIRKGGLGLPMVFAVGIFIIFHFINVFSKKVASQNELHAFFGVFLSSIILTPFAIYLTYRATNDLGFSEFNFKNPFNKYFKKNIDEQST